MGWACWLLITTPYPGAVWAWHTGVVSSVDPFTSSGMYLQPGDRIISIGSQLVTQARPLANGQQVFVIQRNGQHDDVTLSFLPPPSRILVEQLIPIVVALSYWILSIVVVVVPRIHIQQWLAYAFGQTMSVALVAGAVSWPGPWWATQLFGVALWWLGTFAIIFHLYFPILWNLKYRRRLATVALIRPYRD